MSSYFFDQAIEKAKVEMEYHQFTQIQTEYENLEREILNLKQIIKDNKLVLEKSGNYYTIEGIVHGFKNGFGGEIISDLETELEKILTSMTPKEFSKWKKARGHHDFNSWVKLRGQISTIKQGKL